MVTYKVKEGLSETNKNYIKNVFTELMEKQPDGIKYACFVKEDGLSFVHISFIETEDGSNPLTMMKSFTEFTDEIKDRCDILPQADLITEVGNYHLF